MIPIVYRKSYDITAFGLERMHPFDGAKYWRIRNDLVRSGLRRRSDFVRPRPVSKTDLAKLHPGEYTNRLKQSNEVARILELPFVARLPAWVIEWRILRPMRHATGGTIEACRLALRHDLTINLGGGFHHATGENGHGFCVYSDAALAALILHEEGLVERVMVVDLDAHQGDGTAIAFRRNPWAVMFDVFQANIFPARKEPEDYGYPISSGTRGEEYLDLIRTELPMALDFEKPDLVIFNAGVDPFEGDPLAGLKLSAEDLAERDSLVVSLCRLRSVPVAMILSGGYSGESWRIHSNSISRLLRTYDR